MLLKNDNKSIDFLLFDLLLCLFVILAAYGQTNNTLWKRKNYKIIQHNKIIILSQLKKFVIVMQFQQMKRI